MFGEEPVVEGEEDEQRDQAETERRRAGPRTAVPA